MAREHVPGLRHKHAVGSLCAIIRVALVYRGRAIPLRWAVLAHGSATVALDKYQYLLIDVVEVLPVGCKVILLADRGFMDTKLMKVARDLVWHFRIRAKLSLLVHTGTGKRKLSALMPPAGQAHFWRQVWIAAKGFGPLHLALANVRTPNGYEQCAIISAEPTGLHTFDEYGLRFDIEENFLDDKSAGFQLESSQLRDASALQRLCLILSTATLYLVSTGTAMTAMGRRRFIDPHWERGLSYFQIGWRWVRHVLNSGAKLLSFAWLEFGPDPFPAISSYVQARLNFLEFDTLSAF